MEKHAVKLVAAIFCLGVLVRFLVSKNEDEILLVSQRLETGTILECPATLDSSFSFVPNVQDQQAAATSMEVMVSPPGTLCTLVQVSADGKSISPVARSYDRHDWEVSAGKFSGSLEIDDCSSSSCVIHLPLLMDGSIYQLTTFGQPQYTNRDVVARFLEQTTFGVTLQDIDSFSVSDETSPSALNLKFADWIQRQQDPNQVPVMSHRDMWRQHLNARFEVNSRIGHVTQPCQAGTRYRWSAFSIKDLEKTVNFRTQNSKIVLSVDGVDRTVVNTPVYMYQDGYQPINDWADGDYTICSLSEFNNGTHGESLFAVDYLTFGCQPVYFGIDTSIHMYSNPPVVFDSINDIELNNVVVDIPNGAAEAVDTIYFPNHEPQRREIILTQDLRDVACADVNPKSNDPVFAVFDGQYWIHDPRFTLSENTLESPIPDGGGQMVKDFTNSLFPEFSITCSNVPRTFLNQDTCFLSTDSSACPYHVGGVEYDDDDDFNSGDFFTMSHDAIRTIYDATGAGGPETVYFYTVDGLNITRDPEVDPPCKQGSHSRWIPVECSGIKYVNRRTREVLGALIEQYQGEIGNAFLVDVYHPIDHPYACNNVDKEKVGFEVPDLTDKALCWKNVHPDHWSVYDFTSWTVSHPGNLNGRNPIKEFAEAGSSFLTFPDWHELSRWNSNKVNFFGPIRLGAKVNYFDLPGEIRSEELAMALGIEIDDDNNDTPGSTGTVVCGSPFESANEPFLGGSVGRGAFDAVTGRFITTTDTNYFLQRQTVWTNAAMTDPGQLRQRVAWALSQILVISPESFAGTGSLTESFLVYYDIFVRNAFGNYRDVLKEVSYSRMMAEMLTFYGGRSTAYVWEEEGNLEYADENYAREIMQLFTTGLFRLNKDGTEILDSEGFHVSVYSNDDIEEYARAWTGFLSQTRRGNAEDAIEENHIDPMFISAEYRDRFPKMGLDSKYIGDRFPLCSDLPDRHFLSKGANYRLLGAVPTPEHHMDPAEWRNDDSAVYMTLNQASSLYGFLCASGGSDDECSYPMNVILPRTLACYRSECSVDTLRTVKVNNFYYEYIRPACTHQAFYNDAKTLVRRGEGGNAMCGDPRMEIATPACCNEEFSSVVAALKPRAQTNSVDSRGLFDNSKLIWNAGENQDYDFKYSWVQSRPLIFYPLYVKVRNGLVAEATDRMGTKVANEQAHTIDDIFDTIEDAFVQNAYSVSATYDREFGYPTNVIVDYLEDYGDDKLYVTIYDYTPKVSTAWNEMYYGERTTFLTTEERCGGYICGRDNAPSCEYEDVGTECYDHNFRWTNEECNVGVMIDNNGKVAIVHIPNGVAEGDVDSSVNTIDPKTFFRVEWQSDFAAIVSGCEGIESCFLSPSGLCVCMVSVTDEREFSSFPSTPEEVLLRLKIGAFEIDTFPDQTINGIPVYRLGSDGSLTSDSVFEVIDENGVRHLLKNIKSTVSIPGTSAGFRNPPHFINLADEEPRDAHHESDATLDQYLYHSNTAPFLAIRFAQRFGISNPSPRYIETIASAFRSGVYEFKGDESTVSFGSGVYGDLGATFAAVLLDREARTTILDADPAHGSFKEPLIKILGLMKSLEFQLREDEPWVEFGSDLSEKIGQMVHEIPTVFSFFLPEYQPSGPIAQGSLVAPEAQLLTGPRIIDGLNGILSLIRYGFNECFGGFASNDRERNVVRTCNQMGRDDYSLTRGLGELSYQPANGSSSSEIVDELATIMTAGRLNEESRRIIKETAENATTTDFVEAAQLLIVTTPEFHATNLVRMSGNEREPDPPPTPSSSPYKAVVYVLLSGGCDSYNMLVPHTCTETNPNGQTLLEQYYSERTTIAVNDDERSLIIDATGQPCEQFAVHPELPLVERLYREGGLSFFANTGQLDVPVTKDNFRELTRSELFSHNTMQEEAQRLDPLDTAPGTGILGRMADKLSEQGFIAQTITVNDATVATVGVPGQSSVKPMIVSTGDVDQFDVKARQEKFHVGDHVGSLNAQTTLHSSLFGETWSQNVLKSITDSKQLADALENVELTQDYTQSRDRYMKQIETAASVILSHGDRGTDRDVIFIDMSGWDHHTDLKDQLGLQMQRLNSALDNFEKEMKAQGFWDQVTLVAASEFGRTLTTNSGKGSDHAWGGNYMVMGGSVQGGQIHGDYPSDITASGPLNVGRGRLIPTSSWESMLNPILQWMGVEEEDDLDYCMPNRLGTGAQLFTSEDVFKSSRRNMSMRGSG